MTDRDLSCKVDVEDCSDVAEGECVVLCQDSGQGMSSSEGINSIVAMDDNLLWTGDRKFEYPSMAGAPETLYSCERTLSGH